MKRVFNQWLAFFLSVVMIFTMLPAATLATDPDSTQTAVEQVQALINALPEPEETTSETRESVQMLIDAIDAAMPELSSGELEMLDTTRYEAALAALLVLDEYVNSRNNCKDESSKPMGDIDLEKEEWTPIESGGVPHFQENLMVVLQSRLPFLRHRL